MADSVNRRTLVERDPYRELFERSADAILIIEGETFIDCNDAAVRMLRYRDRAAVLETHPSELSPPTQPDGRDSFEKANEMIAIAFAEGSHRFEWDHLRADGEVFPVEVLLTAVQEPNRRVLHVVWRDITERKRLESELRHTQKMEAIGKLAGGIAHDFNNLLVAIVGNGELLADEVEGNAEACEFLDQIQLAADRAGRLVKQLLAFGRKQDVLPTRVDLNARIQGIAALLERLVGDEIELVIDLDDACPQLVADGGQLEQVVMNLATNARDAMPAGGVLSVETRPVQLDETAIGTGDTLPPGEYVLLTVSDTGTGMTPETSERAFDPFFTTKPLGQGTGLGLATVYGIVHQAGGAVTLGSEVGQGTVVKIYFPAARRGLAGSPQLEQPLPAEGGDETILVVEDELAVASLVEKALVKKGYRVLSARDGREALALFERCRGEVDLVLTDVLMPRMGGAELVAELRSAGHSPRVLFMSGFTDNALGRLQGIGADVDVVEKPFHADELAGRVRLALDRE